MFEAEGYRMPATRTCQVEARVGPLGIISGPMDQRESRRGKAAAFRREITTDRLRLRQWLDHDVEPLVRIYADPGFLEHMTPVDAAGTAAQIERFRRDWTEDGFGHWAAEDRQTGTFLGRIGVRRHHDWPLEEGPVEVGWVLAPGARGRGLATEAAGLRSPPPSTTSTWTGSSRSPGPTTRGPAR
jgi:RimJ/RimL family protein N-acetyltransferase